MKRSVGSKSDDVRSTDAGETIRKREAVKGSWLRKIILLLAVGSLCLLTLGITLGHDYVAVFAQRTCRKLRPAKVLIVARRELCELENMLGPKKSGQLSCISTAARAEYASLGCSYKDHLQEYTPFGDFLNYGHTEQWTVTPEVHFDTDSLPLTYDGNGFQYNPVTIENYALSMYGRDLRGDLGSGQRFLLATDRLLRMQDARGAFRYPFRWKYYLSGQTYEPGWVSAMAQGMALSVLARAYHLTGDTRYIDAGDKAFDFLVTPVSEGGVMDTMADLDRSLSGSIIFEEYLAKPSGYTLNGFMYTILGLYDWSHVSNRRAEQADGYFDQAIGTLRRILPYYDIGGFTAYDLGHLTYHHRQPRVDAFYHSVHVFLLHALVSTTQDRQLQRYENLWASYVPK